MPTVRCLFLTGVEVRLSGEVLADVCPCGASPNCTPETPTRVLGLFWNFATRYPSQACWMFLWLALPLSPGLVFLCQVLSNRVHMGPSQLGSTCPHAGVQRASSPNQCSGAAHNQGSLRWIPLTSLVGGWGQGVGTLMGVRGHSKCPTPPPCPCWGAPTCPPHSFAYVPCARRLCSVRTLCQFSVFRSRVSTSPPPASQRPRCLACCRSHDRRGGGGVRGALGAEPRRHNWRVGAAAGPRAVVRGRHGRHGEGGVCFFLGGTERVAPVMETPPTSVLRLPKTESVFDPLHPIKLSFRDLLFLPETGCREGRQALHT